MHNYKTAMAIATAVSLSLSAGLLSAGDAKHENHAEQSKSGEIREADVLGGGDSMARTKPNFEQLDRNDDGEIDEEELSAYRDGSGGQSGSQSDMMQKYDKDDSGTLSQAEMQQAMQAEGTVQVDADSVTVVETGGSSFDELDRNNDGELDQEELSSAGATAVGQSGSEDRSQQMMQDYDEDRSGTLNEEEMRRAQEGSRQN